MRKDAKMEEMRADTRLMIFLCLPTRPVFPSLRVRGNNHSANRTNRPYSFCLNQSLGEKAALLFSLAETQLVFLQNTKADSYWGGHRGKRRGGSDLDVRDNSRSAIGDLPVGMLEVRNG
jgi:hypothetical protein